jgi:hypothetical protein
MEEGTGRTLDKLTLFKQLSPSMVLSLPGLLLSVQPGTKTSIFGHFSESSFPEEALLSPKTYIQSTCMLLSRESLLG